MKNSYNESRVIIRNNIIVIKAIFEIWSELIVVPTVKYSSIFKYSNNNNYRFNVKHIVNFSASFMI
jgi:hypothetical protein